MMEEWELRRLCAKPPPELGVTADCFDGDASPEQRDLAMATCMRCPVQVECYARVQRDILAGREVVGFYAGKLWCSNTAKTRRAHVERTCVREGCGKIFVVDSRNVKKKYCTVGCGEIARNRARAPIPKAERRRRRIARGLPA